MNKKLFLIIPLAVIAMAVAAYFFANYRIKVLVDTHIAEILVNGEYQELGYEKVRLALNGIIILQDLQALDLAGNEYILEEIRVSNFDYFSQVPRHLNLSVKGLRFPAGMPAFGASANSSLSNYLESIMEDDFLPLEFIYRYSYQPEENYRLDITFSVGLLNSFVLTTDAVMENISLENLDENALGPSVNPTQYSMMIFDADVPSASVALMDLGLVNAMLAIKGEELGLSADEYRQQLLSQLQAMVLFTPQQLQSLAQEILARLTEFLDAEKTIRISIAPQYGGNIQRLQGEVLASFYSGNFQGIKDLLNLEIETLPQ